MARARRMSRAWFNDKGGLGYLATHGTDDCYASIKITLNPADKQMDVSAQYVVYDQVTELDEKEVIDILYETMKDGSERAHRIWAYLNEAYKVARDKKNASS